MASSNHSALSRFLTRLLRRSRLNAEERSAILGLKSHASQVDARRDIVLPGQAVDHACLVVDGLVARFDQMKDGRRQITIFHIAGDMCDLHSVPVPIAGWGLAAISTATLLRIPHSEMLGVATRYPAIALAFWRDTIADGSVLAKWVSNLGRRDAQSRIAHLLCEMGVRMEQAGLGSRLCYRFDATQEQIADALGLTPVHVNRMLQSLRSQEVMTLRARMVEVRDWGRLAAIAEFDPRFLLLDEPRESAAA